MVDVASRFFSSNTYGATTVRGIASAADVTPSAIYYRFHDKVGLLAAVAEPLLSDLEALLTGTSASVRSIDRVEVMRGYLLAILQHREAAQVLLFDPSAGGTAPAERLADQQRRMVALLVGPRGTIDRQVRTRCAVAIAQLGAGELKGVPGHRLRKPSVGGGDRRAAGHGRTPDPRERDGRRDARRAVADRTHRSPPAVC